MTPTDEQYEAARRDAANRGTNKGDRAAAQLARWQAGVNHGHKSRGEKIEALARELGECSPGCAHCHSVASALLERAEKETTP